MANGRDLQVKWKVEKAKHAVLWEKLASGRDSFWITFRDDDRRYEPFSDPRFGAGTAEDVVAAKRSCIDVLRRDIGDSFDQFVSQYLPLFLTGEAEPVAKGEATPRAALGDSAVEVADWFREIRAPLVRYFLSAAVLHWTQTESLHRKDVSYLDFLRSNLMRLLECESDTPGVDPRRRDSTAHKEFLSMEEKCQEELPMSTDSREKVGFHLWNAVVARWWFQYSLEAAGKLSVFVANLREGNEDAPDAGTLMPDGLRTALEKAKVGFGVAPHMVDDLYVVAKIIVSAAAEPLKKPDSVNGEALLTDLCRLSGDKSIDEDTLSMAVKSVRDVLNGTTLTPVAAIDGLDLDAKPERGALYARAFSALADQYRDSAFFLNDVMSYYLGTLVGHALHLFVSQTVYAVERQTRPEYAFSRIVVHVFAGWVDCQNEFYSRYAKENPVLSELAREQSPNQDKSARFAVIAPSLLMRATMFGRKCHLVQVDGSDKHVVGLQKLVFTHLPEASDIFLSVVTPPVPSSLFRKLALLVYARNLSEISGIAAARQKLSLPSREDIAEHLEHLHSYESLAYASRKRYRDHLTHTCRIALLGYIMLDECLPCAPGTYTSCLESCTPQPERCPVVTAEWLLSALLHDQGYIFTHLERVGVLVKHIENIPAVGSFLSEFAAGYSRFAREVNLFCQRHLRTETGKDGQPMHFYGSGADHGAISAWIAESLLTDEDPMRLEFVEQVVRNIAFHSCTDKLGHARKTPVRALLAFLDNIQDWNRPVALPAEVMDYIESVFTVGENPQAGGSDMSTVEVKDVYMSWDSKTPDVEKLNPHVLIVLPHESRVLGRTMFDPVAFMADKESQLKRMVVGEDQFKLVLAVQRSGAEFSIDQYIERASEHMSKRRNRLIQLLTHPQTSAPVAADAKKALKHLSTLRSYFAEIGKNCTLAKENSSEWVVRQVLPCAMADFKPFKSNDYALLARVQELVWTEYVGSYYMQVSRRLRSPYGITTEDSSSPSWLQLVSLPTAGPD